MYGGLISPLNHLNLNPFTRQAEKLFTNIAGDAGCPLFFPGPSGEGRNPHLGLLKEENTRDMTCRMYLQLLRASSRILEGFF